MSTLSCLLRSDLSEVRLIGDGASQRWSPAGYGPAEGESSEPAAADFRAIAQSAGQWTAAEATPRKGLALACIDVHETMCVWLRAPSASPPVLASALRALGQDWGPDFAIGSIEAIGAPAAEHARRRPFQRAPKNRPGAEHRGPVLCIPDALPRLWLDELDRRGVRPAAVVTLWHALALAWGGEGEAGMSGAVLIEPDRRLVWAWARGRELAAGGSVTLPAPPMPPSESAIGPPPVPADSSEWLKQAAHRLALDWLSWGAQVGAVPRRLTILGPEAGRLAEALRAGWKDVPVECREEPDPAAITLDRAAEAWRALPAGAPRAGVCLAHLTNRPTRAVRARYLLAGMAILALAVGVAGMGWRLHAASGQLRASAAQVRDEAAALAGTMKRPLVNRTSSLVMDLDKRLAELRKIEPPKLPPPPKPIWQEAKRLTDELARHEGVKLTTLYITMVTAQSSAQVALPEGNPIDVRRIVEGLTPALEAAPPGGGLSWKRQAEGAGAERRLLLRGTWIEGKSP